MVASMNSFAFFTSYDFDHVPMLSLTTPLSLHKSFFAISMQSSSRSPGIIAYARPRSTLFQPYCVS